MHQPADPAVARSSPLSARRGKSLQSGLLLLAVPKVLAVQRPRFGAMTACLFLASGSLGKMIKVAVLRCLQRP